MPTYLVRHVTTYRYASPVVFGEHRFMLRPRDSHDQRTRSATLNIYPEPRDVNWAEDPSGNLIGWARFSTRSRELRFEAAMEVEHTPLDPDAIRLTQRAQLALCASGRGAPRPRCLHRTAASRSGGRREPLGSRHSR